MYKALDRKVYYIYIDTCKSECQRCKREHPSNSIFCTKLEQLTLKTSWETICRLVNYRDINMFSYIFVFLSMVKCIILACFSQLLQHTHVEKTPHEIFLYCHCKSQLGDYVSQNGSEDCFYFCGHDKNSNKWLVKEIFWWTFTLVFCFFVFYLLRLELWLQWILFDIGEYFSIGKKNVTPTESSSLLNWLVV